VVAARVPFPKADWAVKSPNQNRSQLVDSQQLHAKGMVLEYEI
jgi:hypothetical protein